MSFATNGLTIGRIALVLTEPVLRRLTGGLRRLVGPGRDFAVVEPGGEPSRVVAQLLELQPVGIIMEFREELTELVASLGHPVVVVMADMLMDGMGSVNVDDHAVGRLAADYLWERGLRRFGFHGLESLHAPERRTGFLSALERRGAEASVLEVSGSGRSRARRASLEAWLESLPRPAGIFAAHDPLAREVLETCRRIGVQVPAEVAILSASNDQFTCELVYPGISSVEIPWEQVGLEAGQLIEEMLEGRRPGAPVVLSPTGIRTRGSTDFYRVSDERIQAAVAHMRQHLHEDIGIDAVVAAVGMERRTLERLFRAELNRSPKQVLTDMRSDRARELLEQDQLRIGEIAEACGFGTSEKLATAFKGRFAKTPREWRRLHGS